MGDYDLTYTLKRYQFEAPLPHENHSKQLLADGYIGHVWHGDNIFV
jgi:hypothetical protein